MSGNKSFVSLGSICIRAQSLPGKQLSSGASWQVILMEVTAPWEDCIDKANERKRTTFLNICNNLSKKLSKQWVASKVSADLGEINKDCRPISLQGRQYSGHHVTGLGPKTEPCGTPHSNFI